MSLLLAEGEQVVRKYRCAVVDYKSSDNSLDATGLVRKRPDTDGLVVVTNKRVLYYAEAAAPSKGSNIPAMHLQEAFIDRITSTEFIQADAKKNQADAKKNVMLPLALMIVGLLVTIFAILDDMEYMYLVPGVIVLVLGVLFLVLSMKGVDQLMMMKINTVASETGIHVSGMSRRDEQALSFYMMPTPEFKEMASEIGALIIDLQTNGDACIAKWTSE